VKFEVSPVDAPNVNGARLFGLADGRVGEPVGEADLSALKDAVAQGRVAGLYVFDPGPDGTMGDTSWILEARASGKIPLLVVQGVLRTTLAEAADFVLPGVSFAEKEASYTNDRGRLQGAATVVPSPGEAMEDWRILKTLAAELGVPLDYSSAAHVRADIAARYGDRPELAGLPALTFGAAVTARHWLQASNPSERWKWDVMFKDLPPIKGAVEPSALPPPPGVIPLREVKT